MRHVVLERWSRGTSGLHRRDPRAKAAALLILLIVLGTAREGVVLLSAAFLVCLAAGFLSARIPLGAALLRASVVLPFAVPFAVLTLAAGDAPRAQALVAKSYVSALAVLLLVATTPVPLLLAGLEAAGVPSFLLMVAQFLYRYLFVISEEARRMRTAALARGGSTGMAAARGTRFRASAGAVGALFARSYSRAAAIHRAMLARGFDGRLPTLRAPRFGVADAVFAAAAAALSIAARIAAARAA